jgi:hypothetical protein
MVLALALSLAPARASERELVAVVHLHTTVGDGAATPLEIARAARRAGVDAVVVTDHFLERVSYAPWPLGNAFGVARSRPSVMSYGVARYLADLDAAEKAVPGILVVPGVEVTPYARWTGSLLRGDLTLNGWHRHLLVIGLEDPSALAGLPALGNRRGGAYNGWSLLYALPLAGLAWAARRALSPSYREARLGRFRLRQRRLPLPEILAGATCLVLLVLAFPYRVEAYSAVGADPGAAPFGDLIARVRALGGVTVWAHPEARAEGEALGIRITTEPYPGLVRATSADAFGAMPEGTTALLPAGGLWDRALLDYLAGSRPGPPRALAEIDEHRAAASIDFRILQTVFLVRGPGHAGLLEALRAGRLYARWTPEAREPLRLSSWSVESDGRSAGAGETIAAAGRVAVRLAVEGGQGETVTARLVRGGEVIWTQRGATPLTAVLEDEGRRPTYYRLDVEGAYPYRLVSSPIFVRAAA